MPIQITEYHIIGLPHAVLIYSDNPYRDDSYSIVCRGGSFCNCNKKLNIDTWSYEDRVKALELRSKYLGNYGC